MWIFSEAGFISVVQDGEDPELLVVRVRVASDLGLDGLRRYVPDLSPTISTPTRDYPHRARCSREALAVGMARLVMEIDYGNFKSAVAERQGWSREHLYTRVWQIMSTAAEHLALPDAASASADARSTKRVRGRAAKSRQP